MMRGRNDQRNMELIIPVKVCLLQSAAKINGFLILGGKAAVLNLFLQLVDIHNKLSYDLL